MRSRVANKSAQYGGRFPRSDYGNINFNAQKPFLSTIKSQHNIVDSEVIKLTRLLLRETAVCGVGSKVCAHS